MVLLKKYATKKKLRPFRGDNFLNKEYGLTNISIKKLLIKPSKK